MIPKVIHYVWLGNQKKPKLLIKCQKSWLKHLKDYEFMEWNINNIPHNKWVDEALSVKKWAFVADYVRLYALYNYGGIYLDTDVFVKRDFSSILNASFVSAIEYNELKFKQNNQEELLNCQYEKKDKNSIIQGLTIQSAFLASEKNNPVFHNMLKYYETNSFLLDNKSYNYKYLAPDVIAINLEPYGFIYKNVDQKIKIDDTHDGVIFNSSIISSGIAADTKDSYAVHMYSGTWKDYTKVQKIIFKFKNFLKTIMLR